MGLLDIGLLLVPVSSHYGSNHHLRGPKWKHNFGYANVMIDSEMHSTPLSITLTLSSALARGHYFMVHGM